jgi:50S ribosomal protein L16 3-hydroxylase
MSRYPIQVDGRDGPPLGMPAAQFLRDYWQKRPLLVRQAFPGFRAPIDADDLAGLACEPYALSRLVIHDPEQDRWTVETGPFAEERFATLPETDWTLLVQDVDKWHRDVAAVLQPFAFLPDWRIDDVMVSYAAPDGSVGAHVDHYDVFLLQASGHRHWMIDSRPQAAVDIRPDQPLKLLAQFDPDEEWLLEPGDMLYLPPGVPHHGIACGEQRCTTWSIGLRAPSAAELAVDYAEHLADSLPEALRYADPDLAPARTPGEIDGKALERVRALLAASLNANPDAQAQWFGRFITRYRSAGVAAPRSRPFTAAAFARRLAGGGALMRHPLSRFAFHGRGQQVQLFVAGEAFAASADLARRLCHAEPLPLAEGAGLAAADTELLRRLCNLGHLEFVR